MNQDHTHLLDLLEYPNEELDKHISQSKCSEIVDDITRVSNTAIQKLTCVYMYEYHKVEGITIKFIPY